MEKYFINNEKEFYMQNHHSFFMEIDAEMFAIKCMMNEFGSIKEVYNICLEKLIKTNSILDKDAIFNNIEKQRYNAIHNNKII